jgi:hypothetical protein
MSNEMRNIEGVVERTNERSVNTARGQATAYSALLQTGDGEEWFSFGFKRPTIEAGQQVTFVAKSRTFKMRDGGTGTSWDADPNTLEVVKSTPPKAAGRKASGGNMKSAVAAADSRQRSIVLQTAYKIAPLIVCGALEQSLVTLPTKKADKFDAYLEMIDETAMRLAAAFIDPPAVFAVEDEDEAEDVSFGDLEADDEDDEYAPV